MYVCVCCVWKVYILDVVYIYPVYIAVYNGYRTILQSLGRKHCLFLSLSLRIQQVLLKNVQMMPGVTVVPLNLTSAPTYCIGIAKRQSVTHTHTNNNNNNNNNGTNKQTNFLSVSYLSRTDIVISLYLYILYTSIKIIFSLSSELYS